MRAFIFGFLLFCIWSVFSRYYYVCNIKNNCSPVETVDTTAVAPRPESLSFQDGDSVVLRNYEQFAFPESSVEARLTDNNKIFLDSVAAFLQRNEDRSLSITGSYRKSEKGLRSGFYENLGTARAAAIRSLLISRGIDEDRINLDFKEAADTLTEPVVFRASGNSGPENYENGERLVKEQFSFYNMSYSDANFEYDSDVFRPGEAFKLYADSVMTFIENNPGKTLTIVGHTDNVGSDKYNDDLGLRRAKAARKYFLTKGLEAEIRVLSKGKREPMAPNTSPENQQKNRRVNFIID